MLGIIGTMMAAEQASDKTEEAVLDLTRKMCKDIGIDADTRNMDEIKSLLLIKDLKFFRFSKIVDDKPTTFIYILKVDKLIQAGRVTVDVEILDSENEGEMELKVEIEGGLLSDEGIAKMNGGFERWMKNLASI